MSFDYFNNQPMYQQQTPINFAQQQAQQPAPNIYPVATNPLAFETPNIVSGGVQFKIIKDESDKTANIPVDVEITDMEKAFRKKGPGRPRKESGGEIIRATVNAEKVTGAVEDAPTMYSYMETTAMLKETLGQVNELNSELVQEFTSVRHNRTMKNKYNTMIGLSENITGLIGQKVSIIKEINSSINKANEMDYKKAKDSRAAESAMNDDKYIADLYKSFISNPTNVAPATQFPQVDPAIFGSGIVRADLKSNPNAGGVMDAQYLNYMSNLTPEQNLMMYESNPNVKQVVVFDAATGNKFFQMMDVSNGSVIPNVPVYDQMFMEDTTLDLKTKIAKNINLNETFPIIVINEGVTSQY